MLVDSPFITFFVRLFFLFLLVTEKNEKICFYSKNNDFDQQTAPIHWLKYTTHWYLAGTQHAPLNVANTGE